MPGAVSIALNPNGEPESFNADDIRKIGEIFSHQSDISSRNSCRGLCPYPASGIRLGISGNTANADGIRPERFDEICRSGFSFYRYR